MNCSHLVFMCHSIYGLVYAPTKMATLLWWRGLSIPMTLRAMLLGALAPSRVFHGTCWRAPGGRALAGLKPLIGGNFEVSCKASWQASLGMPMAVGKWNVTLLVGKKLELVCEVKRYQLELGSPPPTVWALEPNSWKQAGLSYSEVAHGERHRVDMGDTPR